MSKQEKMGKERRSEEERKNILKNKERILCIAWMSKWHVKCVCVFKLVLGKILCKWLLRSSSSFSQSLVCFANKDVLLDIKVGMPFTQSPN